jgi:hypothetical protein
MSVTDAHLQPRSYKAYAPRALDPLSRVTATSHVFVHHIQ